MKHREWSETANYPGRNCNCGADPVSSDLTEKIGEVLNNIVSRCQPWRAKRRLVDPSSREAALLTRRAHSARGEAK